MREGRVPSRGTPGHCARSTMRADDLIPSEALDSLAARAAAADAERRGPESSWQTLRRAGVTRWCVPPRYGGDGLEGPDLLGGYVRLASACLTTCFLLSQRDAAC